MLLVSLAETLSYESPEAWECLYQFLSSGLVGQCGFWQCRCYRLCPVACLCGFHVWRGRMTSSCYSSHCCRLRGSSPAYFSCILLLDEQLHNRLRLTLILWMLWECLLFLQLLLCCWGFFCKCRAFCLLNICFNPRVTAALFSRSIHLGRKPKATFQLIIHSLPLQSSPLSWNLRR